MSRNKEKFYRFALYGRSGSGKTCFLAAMAMGGEGNPRGLTCSRLPVVVPQPGTDDDKRHRNTANDEHAALHAGQEWIENARRALEAGRRPEANPPTLKVTPPIVEYSIGSPQRPSLFVRTVDYSGELIHPDEEHQQDSPVTALKRCLGEFDGFIILAEVPPSNAGYTTLNDELRRLREAFASLHESNALTNTPVAIAITKWDRWSEVNFSDPEAEVGKLQEYLEKSVAHKSLVDAIRNAQVAQDGQDASSAVGMFHGNCGIFPTTAFGTAMQSDGFDAPAAGDVRPFGLLEPFLWLAERRDYLDAQEMARCWHSHRAIARFYRLPTTKAIHKQAGRLLKRVPRGSAPASQAQNIRRNAATWLLIAMVPWLLGGALLVDVIYESWRSSEFSGRVAQAESPEIPIERMRELRQWFDDYSREWGGLFAPGPDEARQFVSALDKKIEAYYWEPVDSAPTSADKARAAERYIKELPNGAHAAGCREIIATYEASVAAEENNRWLAHRQKSFETAERDKNSDALHKLLEELQEGFPRAEHTTTEQRDEASRLKHKVWDTIAVIVDSKKWEEVVAKYNDAIHSNDPIGASKVLATCNRRDERWQSLAKELCEDAHEIIDRRLAGLLPNHRYLEAMEAVSEAKHALKSLETTVRPDHLTLAEHLQSGQRGIAEYEARVTRLHDQYLYDQVVEKKDKAACEAYLKESPLQRRKAPVEQYVAYLNAITQPLNLQVAVKIEWDPKYDFGDDNIIRVWVDDRLAFKSDEYVAARPGQLSGVVGTISITKKRLSDSVKIAVTITEVDIAWNDDGGQGVATIKVQELIGGKVIQLRPIDNATITNKAHLSISSGLPQSPQLPQWTDQ